MWGPKILNSISNNLIRFEIKIIRPTIPEFCCIHFEVLLYLVIYYFLFSKDMNDETED